MLFKDIPGHDNIKTRLLNSVKQGNIAHAQMFCGISGIGKLQLAIAYARYIQCTDRQENDSCGHCPSCVKYNKLSHPDLHFVFPIISKKSGSKSVCDDYINEWRQFVIENKYFSLQDWLINIGTQNQQAIIYAQESNEIIRKLSVKSYESDYKVMIIWLPEKMNEECSNKLLKILEEPFDKTIFLMISNEPDLLLPTIISRTQQIFVRPLPQELIFNTLVNDYSIDETSAQEIAHLSSGNMLKAVENISISEDKQYFLDMFMSMMRLAYGRKLKEMKLWSEEIAGIGRERQRSFLLYSQQQIRENFINNLHVSQLNYMNRTESAFASRFSPFVNERNVIQIMETLELAENHITQNTNAKMVFFDLSLKFIMLLKGN